MIAVVAMLTLRRFPRYNKLGWTVDRHGSDHNLRVHRKFGDVWVCFHPEAAAYADGIGGGIGYGYAYCLITPRPMAEVAAEKVRPLFSEMEISGEVIILRKPFITLDEVEFPKLLEGINERLAK